MRLIKLPILFLTFITCQQLFLAQTIKLSGTIFEDEFTGDRKISGLFTYMNNSDQGLMLEVVRKDGSKITTAVSRNVDPQRGRQLRVYPQDFVAQEEQIFGDYDVSFYVNDNGKKGDLILNYKNTTKYAPSLRVVSVLFSGINEDDVGRFLEVRIDWQTINSGTKTDTRKFYLKQ